MHIETFFDKETSTFSHVVVDTSAKKCAVIDSVLNYDPVSGKVSSESADKIIDYIRENHLTNEWILETHIHADHITASAYLKSIIGGQQAIGDKIKKVLMLWVPKFDTAIDTPITGEQFDVLFNDGDTFKVGNLSATVWSTPGHTPACSSYLIEDAAFVGDTLFSPHAGTARCDFPGGSAATMYHSIQKLYTLPDKTRLFLCHDYPPKGHKRVSSTTVAHQKENNILLDSSTTEEEYVYARNQRDKTLSAPRLLYPSIQTNMRVGHFGTKAKNGVQYVKTPVFIDMS